MTVQPFDYTVADFTYLEHADGPQRLRLFLPVASRPVPLVVDLHGGAWCNGDLRDCEGRDLTLVRAGLAVAALEFPPCRARAIRRPWWISTSRSAG